MIDGEAEMATRPFIISSGNISFGTNLWIVYTISDVSILQHLSVFHPLYLTADS